MTTSLFIDLAYHKHKPGSLLHLGPNKWL